MHRIRGPGRQLTWIKERNTGSKRKTCHQNKRGRADTHQRKWRSSLTKFWVSSLGSFSHFQLIFLFVCSSEQKLKEAKQGSHDAFFKRNCVNHFTASIYEATLLSQEAADSCFCLWWRGDLNCDKSRQWLRWRLRPNRPLTSSPHTSRLLNPLHHYCEQVSVSSSHHVRNTLDSISKKRPLLPETQQWLQTSEITFQLHLINL